MKNISFVLSFLFLAVLSPQAQAQKKHSESCFWGKECWLKEAEKGDVNSQFALCTLYGTPSDYKGARLDTNIEYDPEKAFYWCQKAAEYGHAMAQTFLSKMYYLGEGIQKDDKQAFEWAYKSAQNGDAAGEYILGKYYFAGVATPKNPKNAVYWFEKSAKQGYSDSQFALGHAYFEGFGGMTRDYKEAYAWFSLAASDGNHNAAHIRDEMEKMLPVETLLEAQSLSREYAEKYKKKHTDFSTDK